jgi:RNA polymerase sigma factor (sigma-70 family)
MKLRNTTECIPNHGEAREAAILQDLDLVNRIARRFQRRIPPCVTFDDLASAGMIGLIHAVDRFDQARGLKFRTYAQHRIWGAMLRRHGRILGAQEHGSEEGGDQEYDDGTHGRWLSRWWSQAGIRCGRPAPRQYTFNHCCPN